MNTPKILAVAVSAALLAACGSDDNKNDDKKVVNAPATYTFDSKVTAGESSVSYSGQVARNTLINELKTLIGSDLTTDLGGLAVDAAVKQKLALVYEGGTNGGTANSGNADLTNKNAYTLAAEVTTVGLSKKTAGATFEEADYSEISSGKNLIGKIAGKDNDLARGEFVGWTIAGEENEKANALVQSWFDAVAAQAADQNHAGSDYVSATGLDYKQLTQKFLLGAVAFSQASNDYLKDSKGLLKGNSAGDKDGTKPYTSLEHQWDEGFGYFGAARDYNNYTDAQLKAQKDNDTNGNKVIDLDSEYTFAMAQYANKRDDSIEGADYSKTIMDNFLKGRQIIQDNFGTDPVAGEGYHAELAAVAKTIIMQWEEIFAANVIHYINATLEDMAAINGNDLGDLAKHWGEMKGFALALQFNPEKTSAMTLAQLKQLHTLLEQAPKLTNDAAYRKQLEDARTLLKTTFKFEGDVTKW
ncbi:DUF4856 domain-containing protein [Bacterioplanoides sp.]|uniref:DUF4856 domain-containing protein n=1 Tax=Bacterioplanoides sp. TaxID=2066072 RepID=UPI003B5ABFB7